MTEDNYNTKKDQQKELERLAGKAEIKREVTFPRQRGWSHIIDQIKYSSGPGDNIYVYG